MEHPRVTMLPPVALGYSYRYRCSSHQAQLVKDSQIVALVYKSQDLYTLSSHQLAPKGLVARVVEHNT